MNNVVLAQIFDGVSSKHSLEQISQSLHISIDDILCGLEELVRKEIAPNVNYLMESEQTLSENQFKRLEQIRIKSVYNKVYQQTAYADEVEREKETDAAISSYFDENLHKFLAIGARQGDTLESMVEDSNLTRTEIIALIKKAVVEDKVKTDVRHMIAQASNEEEKNELLLIQLLSDQIEEPIKADAAEEYIPAEERKLSKEAEKMRGSYAEYFELDGQTLTKCVCIMRKENLCKRYDIEYRPDITEEEICAGIYLYLLGQGYSDILTIKFFPSAYEAFNFYQTNSTNSKDFWFMQHDSDLFDED